MSTGLQGDPENLIWGPVYLLSAKKKKHLKKKFIFLAEISTIPLELHNTFDHSDAC
jgi:hypothetical protein